ncbi:amidohydrolase family protein [Brevibacterium yomogidense]|uniref:Formiminoglutamic iminohydrolase n=1 Tax=Brevibacterium yomogidense TaxID=946573 RepID=A0A1X6WUS8_9MICO|nr:Formiminoglutamic iminohydrolase [Brevibacterium yomogidense]
MTAARPETSALGDASAPAREPGPVGASAFWCERAWVDGAVRDGVLLRTDDAGLLTEVRVGVTAAELPADGVQQLSGIVFPGGVNAHSHAFHRMLRGRTHADGGTFWTWREVMYDVARRLTPESCRVVARAVFAEMLAGGWTSVGEFHYVHHAPGGEPYGRGAGGSEHAAGTHAMELALAAAAEDVGIRMRLLDTCYLTGAIGEELSEEQARFGDGDIDGYLRRHADLARTLEARDSSVRAPSVRAPSPRGTGRRSDGRVSAGVPRTTGPSLADEPNPAERPDAGERSEAPVHGAVFRAGNRCVTGEGEGETAAVEPAAGAPAEAASARLVTLGAAIHSVRAVPAADIARFQELGGPVHIHVSEQPAENDACLASYGRTPTGVLEDAGVLGPALSPVHATHLTEADIAALGAAGTTIVMCPSTEADLADGIGPALDLAHAGATIALGSDQHVVLDALRELQGLEAGERLRSGQRGRFTPTQLIEAMTTGGARSLDLPAGSFEVGRVCDLFAVDPASPRTYGSVGEQVVLAGSSADVHTVVTAGRVRVRDGRHTTLGDIGALYRDAYAALGLDASAAHTRQTAAEVPDATESPS